jgi:hypothetical protein
MSIEVSGESIVTFAASHQDPSYANVGHVAVVVE